MDGSDKKSPDRALEPCSSLTEMELLQTESMGGGGGISFCQLSGFSRCCVTLYKSRDHCAAYYGNGPKRFEVICVWIRS